MTNRRIIGASPWLLQPCGTPPRFPKHQALRDLREPVTKQLLRACLNRDLRVALRDSESDDALDRAQALIAEIPSLERVVVGEVRALIRLIPPAVDIDLSHSEPAWPGLVLVSFPPASEVGDLRLAESIIHEAMHLNLSGWEARIDLHHRGDLIHSPWRDELRPASGVFHGLYVFTCLFRCFGALLSGASLTAAHASHLERRRAQIAGQLRIVARSNLSRVLDEPARSLVHQLTHEFDLTAI